MSPAATRYLELPDAIAAGCERLVHASVVDHACRQRHRRFIGLMLCAPFIVAGSAVTLVTANLGASVTLAVIFATFSICWLTALLVAASGRMNGAACLALMAAVPVLGGLIAAAGGLASPVAILALALPLEAGWVSGSRRQAVLGVFAGLGAIAMQFAFAGMLALDTAGPAAWHWLLPLAWAGTFVPRIAGFRRDAVPEQYRASGNDLEQSLNAVILRVARQGDIADASDKARTILKLPPELLIGTGLFDRIHLADRIAYLEALADMREGASLRKLELRIRLPKDGSPAMGDNYRPFALELMSVADNADLYVAVLRENTEIVELRNALSEANETSASADVAKSRFLAAVSHELRTPLNAIIGFSDMLLHEMFGPFGDPRQKEYVGLVRDSGHHLLDVVTSILDVSRIEAGAYSAQPEPFRFGEAVEMCRTMMQLQAETKGISFGTRIAQDVGEINADRRAVRQILINLVSNAIKFTPEGGEVMIGAQRIGSRLHLWVRDTGIGIAEEDLGNLGQPFMQVHNDYTRRFEGTGLGLSLVKGLVALHEGTMSVESMPGEGTTVTISLPVDGPKGQAEKLVVLPLSSERTDKEDANGSLRKTA